MMGEADLALLLKYPLITSESHKGAKRYKGIITVEYKDYEIDVIEQRSDGKVNFRTTTTFGSEVDEVISKIDSANIVDFLDQVIAYLKIYFSEKKPQNRVNIYRRILHEYCEFVKFYIKIKKSQLSADLSMIHATIEDDGRRDHSVEIRIDFDEIKDIYRFHNPNLPEPLCKDLLKSFGNLTQGFEKFLSIVDKLQPLFDVMDELDRNCCVLEPERPSRRDCYRRIWLDENLSVMVTVDPTNVQTRPDLKFLGAERLILQYRDKIGEQLNEWDQDTDLLDGLLYILALEKFPSKPPSDRGMLMDTGECSICFSLHLNNKLPEVVCSNKSCETVFHVDCLFEWLISINSERIFSEIRGHCPNCEKKISCPLPNTDVAGGSGVM